MQIGDNTELDWLWQPANLSASLAQEMVVISVAESSQPWESSHWEPPIAHWERP